jgi:excisionase family DNA binding protein
MVGLLCKPELHLVGGSMKREQAFTVREAAGELGLSTATIRAWIRQRKIGYLRLGRAIRIPESELRRIIELGTVPAVGRVR